MPPLIAAAWRRPVGIVVAAGTLVAVVLGIVFFHGHSSAFDNRVLLWLLVHVDDAGRRRLLHVSDPSVSFAVVLLVGLVALMTRRWRLLALAAVGPALALGVTELIGKPVVGRVLGTVQDADGVTHVFVGSYPSGHETGVASAAVLLMVAAGQFPWRGWVRALLAAALAVWVVVAGAALVRSFYHYTTDIIGALGLTLAVVLGCALVIDRVGGPRVSSPDARSLPRTSHAA